MKYEKINLQPFDFYQELTTTKHKTRINNFDIFLGSAHFGFKHSLQLLRSLVSLDCLSVANDGENDLRSDYVLSL